MECFAFGLGVGHQNSDDQWLDAYYPKALCRPDPAVVKIIAEVFGWDGTNLTRPITADDLDDFLEALEGGCYVALFRLVVINHHRDCQFGITSDRP